MICRDRTVSSIVLLANSIAFAIQIVVFLVLGSFAGVYERILCPNRLIHVDFGTWRSNILIITSLMGIAIGFGWLGIHTPDRWEVATGLYIAGSMSALLNRGHEQSDSRQRLFIKHPSLFGRQRKI